MRILMYFLLSALVLMSCSMPVVAQTDSGATGSGQEATAPQRDGSHDFDFLIGRLESSIPCAPQPSQWIE
jgi:hypothetical protein